MDDVKQAFTLKTHPQAILSVMGDLSPIEARHYIECQIF
jgi:hypothetical protein